MNSSTRWEFYIDRGGTFTDVVAKTPAGKIIVHKLLSENPEQYQDAPIQGIRDLMSIPQHRPHSHRTNRSSQNGNDGSHQRLIRKKGRSRRFSNYKRFSKMLYGSAIKTALIFLLVTLYFPVCCMSLSSK